MSTRTTDLLDAVEGLKEANAAWREKQLREVEELKRAKEELKGRVEELESQQREVMLGDPNQRRAGGEQPETWIDRKTGERVPVLSHKDCLSDLQPNKTGVSLGRWLRGILTGKHADDAKKLEEEVKALATTPDASGGHTVPAPLAAEFIDLLRARTVISRAGARTIPMTSKTLAMAKLTGDVTTSWHAENASVSASDPTFGVVTLSSKTIVGLVKLSLELSQDSLNVEEMIRRSLAGAMAVAVDAAALGDTVSNGPSGVLSFSGRKTVTGIGALSDYDKFVDALSLLWSANVPADAVGPFVIGTQAARDLAKLKDTTNQPLVKPEVLTMPFLPTTAAEDLGSPLESTGYVADWRDLLWGVRTELTIRVLNEAFFGSNLQLAVLAYMRTDFQPAREASFCTLEGITH